MGRMKKILRSYAEWILLGAAGIPIGCLVGAADALFGTVLQKVTEVRDQWPLYLIPFLALAGIVIAFCYKKFGGKSSQGMNLIFQVGHGEEETIPLRLIPFNMVGTWLTHLFGGSAGREGVAVQIGAAISHCVGKRLPFQNASKIFLITGMAAGFSGLFGTPFAAVLFAMEVLVAGRLEYPALLPAFTASFSASMVAGLLGMEKFSVSLSAETPMDLSFLAKLILLGLIFGLVGGGFAWCLKQAKKILGEKIKNPILRIAGVGLVLSILFLLLYCGRYSGLGTNLIAASFENGAVYSYDWILKFTLTIFTLAAGFQGGEVTPLFSIGTSLGFVLAPIFHLPCELVAALGYASVFGSATNTFLAPMLIGAEIFGYQYLPCFFIVCAVAYVFNMNHSIYSQQKLLLSNHNF